VAALRALPVAGGWTVPGNAWDLLEGQRLSAPPEVTVVVPYYDQQSQLDLVLAALAAQTYPASRLQVVVADDGSPVPPRVPTGVTVVHQGDRGFRAAAARNLGAQAADGSVLCFLDADTVPMPDYVTAASRLPALCPDALVVGRRRHADLSGVLPASLPAWLAAGAGTAELTEPRWLREAYCASGNLREVDDRSYRYVISAVLTLPAALFRAVGGFDEGFASYGGEDWELAHRAFTAGAVLAHEPAAVAWHDGPDQAGRGLGRAAKNAETLALAARICDPHLRGGWWGPYPEIVVEVDHGHPDGLLLCARSALAGGDVEVWLPAAVPALSGDPRVHVGGVLPAVAARARVRVRLDRPVRFAPGELAGLARQVAAPDGGRLTAAGMTVSATRAERRAARHGLALGTLFPVAAAAAPRSLETVPDLAAGLDALARVTNS
jgi:GT2 family glycosyltransferase